MPHLNANGRQVAYTDTGKGPETIVFSHGYLMNSRMFDHQISALKDRYRVIAFDHRGHGQSAPCRAPFGIYDLVDDAEALIRGLTDQPVHFVGMSTGGFVGLRLVLRSPELIRSLTLIDTAAGAEDPAALKQYNQLLFAVRWLGVRPLLGKVMPILMAQPFLTDPDKRADVAFWRAEMSALDKRSIHRFGKAIFSRDDVLADMAALDAPPPTQIIVGADDIATPVAKSQAMEAAIKGAQMTIIPDAGHTSPIEQPELVTAAMTRFLEAQRAAESA